MSLAGLATLAKFDCLRSHNTNENTSSLQPSPMIDTMVSCRYMWHVFNTDDVTSVSIQRGVPVQTRKGPSSLGFAQDKQAKNAVSVSAAISLVLPR